MCNLAEILINVATNALPNLTVFGQLFADIFLNEVHCAAFFGPHCTLLDHNIHVSEPSRKPDVDI